MICRNLIQTCSWKRWRGKEGKKGHNQQEGGGEGREREREGAGERVRLYFNGSIRIIPTTSDDKIKDANE